MTGSSRTVLDQNAARAEFSGKLVTVNQQAIAEWAHDRPFPLASFCCGPPRPRRHPLRWTISLPRAAARRPPNAVDRERNWDFASFFLRRTRTAHANRGKRRPTLGPRRVGE